MACGFAVIALFCTRVLLFEMMLPLCNANQMDPHRFPDKGPFYEKWYVRIIDVDRNFSVAFMFGRVLPSNSNTKAPLSFVMQLVNLQIGGKLDNPTVTFEPSQYSVTKDGQPVLLDPDNETPPRFEAKIANSLSYYVYPTGSNFSVTVGDHILEGVTSSPVPWGPKGKGPEDWLQSMPVSTHWFVYCLTSTVNHYSYTNMRTRQVVSSNSVKGTPVVAHVEKSWGKSFPKAWMWTEGVDPRTGVSFALSVALISDLRFFDLEVVLAGYRNAEKGITCNFRPSNSVKELKYNGCAGTLSLEVKSPYCKVLFEVSAPIESFSSCLLAPAVDGFRKGCVVSYSAVANITVHQRNTIFVPRKKVDKQTVRLAGLQFGEKYMCKAMCPSR